GRDLPGRCTTSPRRNRRTMGASLGMSQEGANLVGGFRRKNVFELARLLFDFSFAVEREAVSEQAFSQAVTSNDIGGALASAWSQLNHHAAVTNGNSRRLQRVMTGIYNTIVIVRFGWMWRGPDQSHLA